MQDPSRRLPRPRTRTGPRYLEAALPGVARNVPPDRFLTLQTVSNLKDRGRGRVRGRGRFGCGHAALGAMQPSCIVCRNQGLKFSDGAEKFFERVRAFAGARIRFFNEVIDRRFVWTGDLVMRRADPICTPFHRVG